MNTYNYLTAFVFGMFLTFILIVLWQYIKDPVFTWVRINLQGDKYNEKALRKAQEQ